MELARPAQPPLVGRAEYIAEIADAVRDRVQAHGGSAVVLRGEAGIGKSRLLEQAISTCRSSGIQVLYAEGEEFSRAVPYAVLAQAVSGFSLEDGDLRSLAHRLGEVLQPSPRQTAADVYAVATQFFGSLRARGPTILSIDDLQLADDDTISLLSLLLQREAPCPLALLTTLRTPELESPALARMFDRLARAGSLVRIEVNPLPDFEVAALIEALTKRPADQRLTAMVQARAGGNPFFVTQVVLSWLETGAISVDTDRSRFNEVPTSLTSDHSSELLGRVLSVDPDTFAVARVAALMGGVRLSRLDLVSELAGMSSGATEAFDRLVERGILTADEAGSYRFGHELLRDALQRTIGPAERWEWHRRIVAWLANVTAVPDVVLERASHMAEIAEPGDDAAISALTDAAHLLSTSAPRSSLPWYQRALELLPEEADPRRVALLAGLAHASFRAGRRKEAAEFGRAALRWLASGDERSQLVDLVSRSLNEVDELDEAIDLLQRERRSGHSDVKSTALSAHLLALVGRRRACDAAAAAAAEVLPDAPLTDQVLGLIDLIHVCVLHDRFSELPGLIDRVFQVAETGTLSDRIAARSKVGFILSQFGDTQRCEAVIDEAHDLLGAYGWTVFSADLAVAEVFNNYRGGRWDRALSSARDIVEHLRETGSNSSLGAVLSIEAEILANRGQWAQARQVRPDAVLFPSSRTYQIWAASGIHLLAGDLSTAESALVAELQEAAASKHRRILATRLAEVLIAQDNGRSAAGLLEEMVSSSLDGVDRWQAELCRVYAIASHDADMLLAVLATADRDGDVALRGRTLLGLGELGMEPSVHLTQAYEIFRRLEAEPLRLRTARELRHRRLKVPRHREPRSTAFTPLERQIATLIHAGSRNREIATALSVSVKTVEAYLTRMYSKTGCSSRLEFARWLDEKGSGLD